LVAPINGIRDHRRHLEHHRIYGHPNMVESAGRL